MRTFIAVDIPDDVKANIGSYIEKIRGNFKNNVKWVPPENLHFTIKFLGDIKESELNTLKDCVADTASGFGNFTIELFGIGFFPSESKPRVIWLGADGGADRLLEIFQNLESCLEEHGYDREARTFSPHLTIGRVKKYIQFSAPGKIVEFEPVRFRAEGLSIVKSTLTPQGPIYEKLFESCFDGVTV